MENFTDIKSLKEKVKAGEYIDMKFFNIYNKLGKKNSINPLFFIYLD